MTCSSPESPQLVVFNPKISSDCSVTNFSDMSNICFMERSSVFLTECKLSEKFLHEYRCWQCRRQKITILKNVCCCLVLHLLRIGSASFELDHPPCARMIWILTTFPILLRCKNSSCRFQQLNLSVCCANTTGRPGLSSINSSDFHS